MTTHVEGPPAEVAARIGVLARERIDREPALPAFRSDPFWKGLRDLGSEPWLDSGDLEASAPIWTPDFTALTTNNTLLDEEVRKGTYDDLIRRAGRELARLDREGRIAEIGLLLNARHGLRLARAFGARVSVELHTSLAHDVRGTIDHGRRLHEISPDRFIVKVPFTPAGLIAAARLRGEGIPVNMTLGFSARQNYLAARFAAPAYVNVFLGRLDSYVSGNGLGDGKGIGERATLASQAVLDEVARTGAPRVRQIAASLREPSQVAALAGVDVLTMPLKVAEGARKSLDGRWTSRRGTIPPTALAAGTNPDEVRIDVLWDISGADRALADDLTTRPPRSAEEILQRAREARAGDLFPRLEPPDLERIARDGKVPRHEAWKSRIRAGEAAIDSLLNLAGLASFAASQEGIDGRIGRILNEA